MSQTTFISCCYLMGIPAGGVVGWCFSGACVCMEAVAVAWQEVNHRAYHVEVFLGVYVLTGGG